MRLVHLDVVHVALPVFDEAAVVGGQHPQVVVAPDHRPYSRVVSLKMSRTDAVSSARVQRGKLISNVTKLVKIRIRRMRILTFKIRRMRTEAFILSVGM